MHVDEIRHAPLVDGISGTYQTLREMARIVREDSTDLRVRAIAESIVSGCAGHEFECEVQAIFSYCRDAITYRRDPIEQERIQDTLRTVHLFNSGDCDDKIVCLAGLLGSLGHKSRFVIIGPRAEKFTHVYLEVQTKGGWLPLDPTPEQAPMGWEARALHRDVYEIWGNETGSLVGLLALGALAYWWLK